MPRGGKRAPGEGKKLGRPKTKPLPRIRRDVAFDVLEEINKKDSKLNPTGRTELMRWIEFLDSSSEDVALRALGRLKDSVDGTPKQKLEETVVFDPNQPLRVIVEHIGGSKNSAAAKAK
jgi:hypothetical protein